MVYEEIADPFRRLVRIMERLQEPGGCPWDIEQTHQSLKPYLIEEAYETLDAIDSGDDDALAEELGDVLLQVVFHSTLARRTGRFTIDDVANHTANKMVRRHPHVFGDFEATTADEVLINWEKLKTAERAQTRTDAATSAGPNTGTDAPAPEKPKGVLDGVPSHLPALLRAHRMQEKAARTGFEWKHISSALDKVSEEIAEFRAAVEARHQAGAAASASDNNAAADTGAHAQTELDARAQAELGDLLFSLVNVARYLKLDAEEALRGTCNRFKQRIEHIESAAHKDGRTIHDLSADEMLSHWDDAKTGEG